MRACARRTPLATRAQGGGFDVVIGAEVAYSSPEAVRALFKTVHALLLPTDRRNSPLFVMAHSTPWTDNGTIRREIEAQAAKYGLRHVAVPLEECLLPCVG